MKPGGKHKFRFSCLTLVLVVSVSTEMSYAQDDIRAGEELYMDNCMICHSDDGTGAMPGVSDLTLNRRWAEQPETRTVTEIKQGFDSPELAVSMPPKGGNPDLTDSDLLKIVHYMKSEFIEPN